ncbi:hypothetical protein PR003_g14902 [Phytophthora rubi]|uniref:FAD-binding FR-type domain-containing protein n=2 Tax=Phytophthora TaxID=4783 RepID=A0A6A4F3J4_9STRA|nr:hypothetical protein PR003_g14902 [Phytophthora rubi]
MAALDSPKTPKADHTAVMENADKTLTTQPSLPILASGGKPDMWEPVSARSGDCDYVNDLQTPSRSNSSCLPSPLRKLARSWMVLRWQLARNFFSVPLPVLTSMLDIKLGDLFVTLPICVAFIVSTAMQAINDREVEGSDGPPTFGLLVVFILTVRNNSVLLALTGISYERVLFYHKVAALVTIVLSGLHGLAYVLAYNKGEISGEGSMVFTGTVAFAAMVLMFVLSLGFVRRKFFELFLRTHWVLFVVVLVFAVMHGASTALIAVIPWGIDMAFRHAYRPRVYARGSVLGGNKTDSVDNVVSDKRMGVIARDQVTVTSLPGNILQLQFPRVRKDTGESFNYAAGQYVFLCVPSISSLQWHPFTISSSPHEPMVTFHIKALGDWTYKFLSIDIEDPNTYSHVVLFSGGIGMTPMRSIVNWLHHQVHHGGRSNVERVHFVWSVRDREMLQSLVIDEAHKTGEYKGESYFPNGIVQDRGGAFSSEIHLTRSERDVESADIDRHLHGRLHYGARPDVAATLRSIGEQAKQSGKKRVGVLVCGPSTMVRDVVDKSLSLSWEMKVRFDVHSEVFEF